MNRTEIDRRYREKDPERAREKTRRWQRANREKIREYVQANREIYNAAARRHNASLRATVLSHYGHACACCGSSERLSVDHVAGDGGAHRRMVGNGRPASSTQLHRWLIANGFPPGFQVLCHRCNRSKANGASCQLAHGSIQ